MKKTVISLAVVAVALLMNACTSTVTVEEGENSETSGSSDVVTAEINSMLDNFEAGLVPYSSIKSIGDYNKTPTAEGEWNYESEEENDGIQIVKRYTKHHSNKDKISKYSIAINMNDKFELDYDELETDEEVEKAEAEEEKKLKELDDKCYNLINARFPDATYELFNGDHSWKITKGDYEYTISLGFNSYDITISVW